MIDTVLLVAVLGIAAAGAVWDIAERRIPNWLCLLLAAAAAAYSYFGLGLDALGSSAVHAVLALLVGMGLFAAGIIGGGDAKFYAGAAFALPLSKAAPMIGWTVGAGFVLLVIMVLGKRLVVRSGYSIAELRKMQLPYGVAIACGLAVTLFTA